jgi:hypothetical protein
MVEATSKLPIRYKYNKSVARTRLKGKPLLAQRRIRQNAVTALGHFVSWFVEITYIGLICGFRIVLDSKTNMQGSDSHFHKLLFSSI